jgi:predicted lipid carrier protein YhbT
MHVTREHAKGDAAVRGPASDLLLVVYGRKPTDAVEVLGDASLFDRFREQAKF